VRAGFVHNDYLNTLVDYGATGLLLIFAVMVLLLVGVWQTWRAVRGPPADLGRTRGSNKLAFVIGASLGLLALLVHSAVDFNMHITANALVAVSLMALLSSHLRFATERYWGGGAIWVRALATGMCLAAVAWLAVQGTHRFNEEFWLARAAQAPVFSRAQVDLLTKAFAAEPSNPDTANAIGEALRRQSQEGGVSYQDQPGTDYRQLADRAMDWFSRGMKLNPLDQRNFYGYGWCLDWLGRSQESGAYFDRAEQLDPNGYYTMNNIGMHYMELGDYAAARSWFERSLRLETQDPFIARSYLEVVNRRLLEAATNEISARLAIERQP